MFATHPVPSPYRVPLVGGVDARFRRALLVSAGLGVAFLIAVALAPDPEPVESTVEDIPHRLARLILEEPRVTAPAPAVPRPRVEVEAPPVTEAPETKTPEPTETPEAPAPRRTPREETPKLAEDRGTAGRAQAKTEVGERLEAVTASVDETLESLAAVLPAASAGGDADAPKTSRRRGGRVRAGRGAASPPDVAARATERGGAATGDALQADRVDLTAYGSLDLSGVTGSDVAPRPSSAVAETGGDRKAADLMNVVRRHAPGIRFCYDTALEADASLRGKMVFRITVAADGSVGDVEVVEDTLTSSAVRSCALAQIQAWRFGRAPKASVFDAPFVFRPQG